MSAWGRAIVGAMNGFKNESETGLVRMFRVEYAKEYRQMKNMGYEINDSFVKSFLKTRN